jgi:hypothetical protein
VEVSSFDVFVNRLGRVAVLVAIDPALTRAVLSELEHAHLAERLAVVVVEVSWVSLTY